MIQTILVLSWRKQQKTNVWYNLSCLQQTYYSMSTNKKTVR